MWPGTGGELSYHMSTFPLSGTRNPESESRGREVSLVSRNAALPPRAPSSYWAILNQALTLFGGKSVTEEQNVLVAEAGILLNKIQCAFHSGNYSTKGGETKGEKLVLLHM